MNSTRNIFSDNARLSSVILLSGLNECKIYMFSKYERLKKCFWKYLVDLRYKINSLFSRLLIKVIQLKETAVDDEDDFFASP